MIGLADSRARGEVDINRLVRRQVYTIMMYLYKLYELKVCLSYTAVAWRSSFSLKLKNISLLTLTVIGWIDVI